MSEKKVGVLLARYIRAPVVQRLRTAGCTRNFGTSSFCKQLSEAGGEFLRTGSELPEAGRRLIDVFSIVFDLFR